MAILIIVNRLNVDVDASFFVNPAKQLLTAKSDVSSGNEHFK